MMEVFADAIAWRLPTRGKKAAKRESHFLGLEIALNDFSAIHRTNYHDPIPNLWRKFA